MAFGKTQGLNVIFASNNNETYTQNEKLFVFFLSTKVFDKKKYKCLLVAHAELEKKICAVLCIFCSQNQSFRKGFKNKVKDS